MLTSRDSIERKIYVIRNRRVMIDRDLAELYGVKSKRLREQVRRNKKRFPLDFMFQLTEKETDFMVTQNASPSKKYYGGYLPYVFTEHGAVMLASVLNTKRAVEVSIFVVRAFSKMREILSMHKELSDKLNLLAETVGGHDAQIRDILKVIRQLITPPANPKRQIGFKTHSE